MEGSNYQSGQSASAYAAARQTNVEAPTPSAPPALDQVLNQSRYILEQSLGIMKELSIYVDAISGDQPQPGVDTPKDLPPCGGRVGEIFSNNAEAVRILGMLSLQVNRLRRI